ncbi:MAG: hypothetical protein GXZ11_01420 [Tissierellia bacterium]|nr:hypothetical protein [Tissierellia bacterium]
MRIRGFASTPDLDRDNETVMQNGLDISDFVEYGFFNLDHDNSIILGYPDAKETKITKSGLYVEGTLLDTPRSREIWESAVAMKKSNAPRKLGFSIEGKVLARDDKGKILKAKVTNVAITATPVNPHATWDAIVKSMTALSTDTGGALMPESIEGIKSFVDRVELNDNQAMESLNYLQDKLNKSDNLEDVKLYLQLFRGFSGEELDIKLNEVLAIMQE